MSRLSAAIADIPLMTLLIASALGCPMGPPDHEEESVEPPVVGGIEVVPSVVFAAPGAKVALRARLRTTTGDIMPPLSSYAPAWSWVTSAVNVSIVNLASLTAPVPSPAYTTEVLVPPSMGATDLAVEATFAGHSEQATIMIREAIGDQVVSEVASNAYPVIALIHGMLGASCVEYSDEKPVAFVGTASVGDFSAACSDLFNPWGRVALFAPDRRMGFARTDWSPASDVVNFATGAVPGQLVQQALGIPIEVHLTMWVPTGAATTDAGGPQAEALAEMDRANYIYGTSYAGFKFVVDEVKLRFLPSVLAGSDPNWCAGVPAQLDPEIPSSAFGPDKVNVIYVDALVDQPLADTYPVVSYAGYRGYSCPASTHGVIILIEWASKFPNTLAHELAHAMALRKPPLPHDGHTADIGGFHLSDNLMLTSVDDQVLIARGHLSLGQVFRMNVDATSWINPPVRPPGAPIAQLATGQDAPPVCQCDPYSAKPCPPLYVDIWPWNTSFWPSVGCSP